MRGDTEAGKNDAECSNRTQAQRRVEPEAVQRYCEGEVWTEQKGNTI